MVIAKKGLNHQEYLQEQVPLANELIVIIRNTGIGSIYKISWDNKAVDSLL